MNREFGDVSSDTCLNETEKEEDQGVAKSEDPFYGTGGEETKEERPEEENETDENETGDNVIEETVTEENDEEEQPVANVAMTREELQKMLDDFKTLCKNHLKKLTDATSAFTNVEGEDTQNQEQQKLKKKRKLKLKKKPKLLYNLIMICMMIVLLMQIHMYLLLYNKFSTVHQEIKGVSCAIFGKNCPDPKKAYECLKNKMDFTEIENIRALAILQRNIEELFFTVNNISDTVKLTYYHFVINKDEDDDEVDKSNVNNNDIKFNKPPRTRTIYINP